MSQSKTYLNVPYSEKDAVKALGGRWDPTKKKWYVPANKDLLPFLKWHSETTVDKPSLAKAKAFSGTANSKQKKSTQGAVTHPIDKEFLAYSGEQPPWD